MLSFGRTRARIRSARGSYIKMKCPSTLSRAPPPMGNRNRPIVPSTVPAGPIARRGGGGIDIIWLRVYDPIFVLPNKTCPLLENKTPGQSQQSPPPMGNRNRPIGPSTVPGRAHCPSGGGGIVPLFLQDNSSTFIKAPYKDVYIFFTKNFLLHDKQITI